MLNKTALAAMGGAFIIAVTTAVPAMAIQCQGRLQWNSAAGGWISTPYCEDYLVAAVAQSRGMNVSANAVRQNPHVKRDACQFAGSDVRIRDICAGSMFEENGRPRH